MQEKQFKELIVKRLAEISLLKGIELKEEHYTTWANKIINDYNSGLIQTYEDIKKGFEKLEAEKSYGGLDYAVFIDGAFYEKSNFQKELDNIRVEKEWTECLASAKSGGEKPISARAAKALNSLGGMMWLRNSNPNEVNWAKKNFIDAWKNTREPENGDFICAGLIGGMYLDITDKLDGFPKQIED